MPRKAAAPPKELPNEVALDRFRGDAIADWGDDDAIELAAHLYAAFRHWCGKKRIAPMTPQAFGRELGKTMEYEPIRLGSERQKAWRGIRLVREWKKIAELASDKRKPRNKPGFTLVVNKRWRPKPRAMVSAFSCLPLNATPPPLSLWRPFTRRIANGAATSINGR